MGMLLTAICDAGTVASSVNVALSPGSSQQGMNRRAFVGSKCVKIARRASAPEP
jgi:hypothetical protein